MISWQTELDFAYYVLIVGWVLLVALVVASIVWSYHAPTLQALALERAPILTVRALLAWDWVYDRLLPMPATAAAPDGVARAIGAGSLFDGESPFDPAPARPSPAPVVPFLPRSSAAPPEKITPAGDAGTLLPGRHATDRHQHATSTPGVAAAAAAAPAPSLVADDLALSAIVEELARLLHRASVTIVYGREADVSSEAFEQLYVSAQARFRTDAELIIRTLDPSIRTAGMVGAARVAPDFERALACYYGTLLATPLRGPLRRRQP